MNDDFGFRGVVAPVSERNTGLYTSADMLAQRLKTVRSFINDDSPFKQRFGDAECEKLVTEMFGGDKKIDVAKALERLRKEADTPEKKLLIRTLAVYSFDPISPEQTKRIDLKQFYEDLHITEKDLLPRPRVSGTKKFLAFTLMSDDVGLFKLHIFPPEAADVSAKLVDEMLPHQHYMDSSSIIIAGEVVNKHYKVHTSSDPADTRLALYDVSRGDRNSEGGLDKVYAKRAHVDSLELTASHHYKSGDYYHIPGVLRSDFPARTSLPLTSEVSQTFHTTESHGLAATLFTQRKTPHLLNDAVIEKYDEYGEGHRRPYKETVISIDECYPLLLQADAEIKKQLSNVHKVNCGHLGALTESYLSGHHHSP